MCGHKCISSSSSQASCKKELKVILSCARLDCDERSVDLRYALETYFNGPLSEDFLPAVIQTSLVVEDSKEVNDSKREKNPSYVFLPCFDSPDNMVNCSSDETTYDSRDSFHTLNSIFVLDVGSVNTRTRSLNMNEEALMMVEEMRVGLDCNISLCIGLAMKLSFILKPVISDEVSGKISPTYLKGFW